MKTIVTETGSVYELSDADDSGYVVVSLKRDNVDVEALGDDIFPMIAKVNGYDAHEGTPVEDIVVGYALQILPQRNEMNIALDSAYVGIVTSPVAEIS